MKQTSSKYITRTLILNPTISIMLLIKTKFPALLIVLSLSSCTIFEKRIKTPVTIALSSNTPYISIKSTASETRYISNLLNDTVANEFKRSFLKEAQTIPNITVTNDTTKSDFIIKILSLKLLETSASEKIDDEKSEFHGKEVVLNSVECNAEIEVIDTKNPNKKLKTCFDSKSRSEKLKNNRDLGDLILSQNKDHTYYRTKPLRSYIAMDLVDDVGRRIWVPVTRRIAK